MSQQWVPGNRYTLLENGEEFFPRVFEAIGQAEHEVLIETFILFEDKVGQALHAALLEAARRGAQIDLTVDGFGSPNLSPEFITALTSVGVRVHVFEPGSKIFGQRLNVFRRLHRKLVVVDGKHAFVGGINYSADHLLDFGPMAKQDYAVEIEGPLVGRIRQFAVDAVAQGYRGQRRLRRTQPATLTTLPPAGNALGMLVTRDNGQHRTDIERHYRVAIRLARKRVVIANAYFFPGYRLLRELRRAARRGVEVILILQGEPDMPIVKTAAHSLFDHLLHAGVRIFEYCERPLHAKVALIDDEWSTVGSSNLDPLSLSLNLEANVMMRDRHLHGDLSRRLQQLMEHGCTEVEATQRAAPNWWRVLRSTLVYHLVRIYPSMGSWLGPHEPQLVPLGAQPAAGVDHVTEPKAG